MKEKAVEIKRGLADNNLSAMRKYLDGCKTGNSRFDGYEAINAIVASGGIPVWAHPLGGEGEVHSSEQEFLDKLIIMRNAGIKGLECYYSRYSKDEIEFLVHCANENGLLITGGSDYHGDNKPHIKFIYSPIYNSIWIGGILLISYEIFFFLYIAIGVYLES